MTEEIILNYSFNFKDICFIKRKKFIKIKVCRDKKTQAYVIKEEKLNCQNACDELLTWNME